MLALNHSPMIFRSAFRESTSLRARAGHQDFLRVWQHADPDILILKQAKTEYGKLR
jgi:hypothetical protein